MPEPQSTSAITSRCVRYSVLDGVEKCRPVELDEDRAAHHVVLDFGPGQFGVRWEWPPAGGGTGERIPGSGRAKDSRN
ncbi:hypothetical protein F4560_003125 [Saccharothrix ecbatanensis]|uniref:Uncharacterized protein n=1 Tax=Saccharothrix ecbatanensis TaxID=1105145 RepID=A0A7W9HJC4_9PSEU|nr:hypothetical protein [Saccharothrix ecbatanensis]MBB5803357.1 hypothetical protein [Saccharothrix ecbatanensis]